MRKDDVLTMKEVEKLDRMLDENSKMIYREKHNRNFNIRRVILKDKKKWLRDEGITMRYSLIPIHGT
jgi:hypothetical protein